MKIGIAGLGKMGTNHLNELRKDDEFKVAALYDLRQNAEFKEPFYTNLDEFLSANLDIVIIATPTSTHLELAKAILAKVKCVLIEKPLAMNLKEMNEIKELAKKHESSVAVGFSERFNPAILALKKELANEKIISINIKRYSPFPARISDVGILQDLSIHDIDLVGFLSGESFAKQGLLSLKKDGREIEAIITLQSGLNSKQNIIAAVHQSWNCALKIRLVSVITENAFFEADLNNFSLQKNGLPLALQGTSPLFSEHKELLSLAKSGKMGRLASIKDALNAQACLE